MMIPSLQRHIDLCNNFELPAGRRRFLIGAAHVGWIDPQILQALLVFDAMLDDGNSVVLDPARAGELHEIGRQISAQGFYLHRGEAFDVRASVDGKVLATLDRGALPWFGVEAVGVHVNGLVHRADGLHLWVARRARHKFLDGGKLDHLVAGGVSAGMGPWETLIKEAGEEAAIPPDLAALALHVATLSYTMLRSEGLRRDTLFCYDLVLPEDFTPKPNDGEVESFELWPISRVLDTVQAGDEFKFNVNLVLIDLFARLGIVGKQA